MNAPIMTTPSNSAANTIEKVTLDAAPQETRMVESTSLKKRSPGQQAGGNEVKENRWKLAFRQLMFMKDMNNQFNNRTKNEIELRQQHITPLSLVCSIPFFNSLSSDEVKDLVRVSQRLQLRPGDRISLRCQGGTEVQNFYIIISGNVVKAHERIENVRSLRQMELSPDSKLGIGDFFVSHPKSIMKIVALEFVEYLSIPMESIAKLNENIFKVIEAGRDTSPHDTLETQSYKRWAHHFAASVHGHTQSDGVSSSGGGYSKTTVKSYSRDILLHISAENDLDHTLEYVKNTLLSTFNAHKVRIYTVEENVGTCSLKFSNVKVLKVLADFSSGLTKKILEKRSPLSITDLSTIMETDNEVMKTLYHPTDIVLAAPFFQYDPLDDEKIDTSTRIVGILEVVICQTLPDTSQPSSPPPPWIPPPPPSPTSSAPGSRPSPSKSPKAISMKFNFKKPPPPPPLPPNNGEPAASPATSPLPSPKQPTIFVPRVATFTENDTRVLDVSTKEVGRYLFFHYRKFFGSQTRDARHESNKIKDQEGDLPSDMFPSVDPAVPDVTSIGVYMEELVIDMSERITSAVLNVCLGKMVLSSKKIAASNTNNTPSPRATSPTASSSGNGFNGPPSPSKSSPSKEKVKTRVWAFENIEDIGIPLSNLPHGSHLMLHFYAKNELVAWTGVHFFDFEHTLRNGRLSLDVSSSDVTRATALEIENCHRSSSSTINSQIPCPPNKTTIGRLNFEIRCNQYNFRHHLSFSSVDRPNPVRFRTSIFGTTAAGQSNAVGLPRDTLIGPNPAQLASIANLRKEHKQLLGKLKSDPLAQISKEERDFLWESRDILSEDAALLPAILLCVDWSKRSQVLEAYRLMIAWRQPSYLQALQLLSPLYPDPKVRAYAVRCMHSLPDHRLRLYLLQLIQALKNERYHDSALSRFLLMRGLLNPAEIGYSLYWFLKAEAHVDQTSERFELMMDQYLQLCGSYKLEIRQSVYVMKKLEEIAFRVKQENSQKLRKVKLHEEINKSLLPDTFQLPLHPRTFCNKIITEKCRVMESKKKPLFLQLENAKAGHGRTNVIFKSGDDLRQDQLVLQLLRVMDDLWMEAGLDLCLSPYACISTGDEIGLIEVVDDAETLASIIYNRQSKSYTKLGRKLVAAKDALMGDGIISDWLLKTTPSTNTNAQDSSKSPKSPRFPLSPRSFRRGKRQGSDGEGWVKNPQEEEIIQNFVRSCAGYCVATYVLGIGDRHNDNLMLQRSGKFFHIDFGHFLGNFKSKFGVKRERAPFVFTPSMLDVMGGKKSENFTKFKRIACEAFQVLRWHSNLLITLLVLALSCGIPELTCEEEIKWVHKTLMIDLSDEEAEEKFMKLIMVALHTKTTQLNDAVHVMAH